MTYDTAPEIIELVNRHGFAAVRVAMKNTHHARLSELVVTRHPVFGPARLDTALRSSETLSRAEFEASLGDKLHSLS